MIETERLVLRPPVRDDVEPFVAMHAEPGVKEIMGDWDEARVLDWMERNEGDWREYGYGRLSIIERESGLFVGRSGLKFWPEFGETEAGWVLHPDVWGRGYATEAGRACLDWGFRDFGLPYITAMIVPHNHRSIAVAERLGMAPLRDDVLMGDGVVVYSRQLGSADADT